MDLEPLLQEDPTRLALFPIQYPTIYEAYRKHVKMFWHADEIDFKQDIHDWRNKLSAAERAYISHVLAFFASSENTVMDNLALRFLKDVKAPESQHFYAFQLAMEAIHSETYSKMIDVLLSSFSEKPEEVQAEKKKLFGAVATVPSIKAKCEWAQHWIDDNKASFAERLVAFICMEGIGFIGSFASIFWLKKRGLLPGVCFANEQISKDESLHRDTGVLHFWLLQKRPAPARILEIVTSFVDLEIKFVEDALNVSVLGMNAEDMADYIRFVGDRLLQDLGMPIYYKVKNPLPWMAAQGMDSKTNFFEKRVSNYQKPLSEKKFSTSLAAFEEEED